MTEQQLQSNIIKWLKSKGCVVVKLQAGPGTPVGISDIVFFRESFYGFIEVKKSKTAKKQPLQQEWVDKFNDWSWARFVFPANWEEVKAELEYML